MKKIVPHTPGPWEVKDDQDLTEIRAVNEDGQWIAETHWPYSRRGRKVTPKEIANARLIAAAPELLFALKLVSDSGPLNNGLRDDNTMAEVRAAISKAEGK